MMHTSDTKSDTLKSAPDVATGSNETVDVGEGNWTEEEETAIRRKFDLTITPLVTLLYMLCAIDRQV